MFQLGWLELLIVLALLYFLVRTWMSGRWPELVRRINWALYLSLAATLLYRVVIYFREP